MVPPRPLVRGDCFRVPRPCPFVGCRFHLYLEVQRGKVRLNHPELEPDELTESCALDVAERGGLSLAEVGQVVGLTRERVRQLADGAAGKLLAVLSEFRGKALQNQAFDTLPLVKPEAPERSLEIQSFASANTERL